MSILGRFLPALISNIRQNACNTLLSKASFHAITQTGVQSNGKPGGLFDIFTRNNIRCHFPRPSERKRIKRHGYWKRMSTEAGRRIIMRRILKGKHVLSH